MAIPMWTFKKLNLKQRIILLSLSLVSTIMILTNVLYYFTLSYTIEGQIGRRALHVAETVASLSEIRAAFKTEEPWEIIQPIVERIRIETDAEFIVVGNKHGVRYSHPNPDRIGKEMVGGDNARALIDGESYVSKSIGTLGPSLRGKVPIKDENQKIIGVVSVGFLMEDITEIVRKSASGIVWIAILGIFIGVLGSVYLARNIKASLFGLEPEEISSLYKERDAVIQSVREGIIVVNKNGNIALLNQAACDILELPNDKEILGEKVTNIIPNSTILDVLYTGYEQHDRPIQIRGKEVIVNRVPVISGQSVIGVVSSFRLKSEIDQLTEELSQVKRYADTLRAQTHEFNNILYTLSGLLQLESYKEAIDLIHKETEIQQRFSQFVIKKIHDPLLSGILLGFYNRARELKIDFMIDIESSLDKLPPHIATNDIVSILGNLFTNAFEAVQKNKAHEKKVRLFVTDIGDDLLLEVEDSGNGIPDEVYPYIFDRGFSTKIGENRGNGLAKIKELVDEFHGTISIEEGELGGTSFIIAIPKKGAMDDE